MHLTQDVQCDLVVRKRKRKNGDGKTTYMSYLLKKTMYREKSPFENDRLDIQDPDETLKNE